MRCLMQHAFELRTRSGLMAIVLAALCAAGATNVQAAPGGNAAQRQGLVASHLEFGEFARAIEISKTATNAEEKSQLLALVANAQIKAGDTSSSRGSIRMMSDSSQRQQSLNQLTAERSLAGGAQADFTQIIALIRSETNGMWEDTDGTGGSMSEFTQGVRVDPAGALTKLSKEEQSGQLRDLGVRAREALLNEDVAALSDLRVVSLTRLERSVAARLSEGKPLVESQKLMGGLTKISNVFVYPDLGEVVIAGPSEAWKYNENGVAVGVKSGRPVLQLDDFVAVLRAFSDSDGNNRFFSCSINGRQEGLKQLKDLVEKTNARGPLPAGAAVTNWVGQLQKALGPQDIVFTGINPESRAARVIIEADYRMKMIGIGKSVNDAKIPSIFELMTVQEQKSGKLDALRWWLTMKYDSILHSPDGTSFELVGSSVLCQSENQYLNDLGQQVQTGQSEGANRLFAETFTRRYEELAKYDLVFADLKNVFDLSLVASLVHNQGAAQKAGWSYGVFANDGAYHPAIFDRPREVDSVVNHRVYRGRDIVVQVAGGVRADMGSVLDDSKVYVTGTQVSAVASKAGAKQVVPANRWWWDAK